MPLNSLQSVIGFALLSVALVFSGCESSNGPKAGTPEDVLKNYIEQTFTIKETSDRKKLSKYLTDTALERFEKMTPAFFNQKFVTPKRKFKRLAFRESKRIDDAEVQITYELEYADQSPAFTALVAQRKLCTMIRTTEGWKLAQVRNLNESVEYVEGMKLSF